MELTEVANENDSEWWDLMYGKPSTECICPKCGSRHKLKLRWAGRGVPRKFCSSCKKVVVNCQMDGYYNLYVPIKNIS